MLKPKRCLFLIKVVCTKFIEKHTNNQYLKTFRMTIKNLKKIGDKRINISKP